jgi:hypothetical protein
LLATKFLEETLGKLVRENDQFLSLLQENKASISSGYYSMIRDTHQFSLFSKKEPRLFFFAEPVLSEIPCSDLQKNYTISAVDGSQILSDQLDIKFSPFLFINIGLIQTNYPKREVVKFDSYPIIITEQGLRKEIASYRTKGEFDVAMETISSLQENNILLIDGGLLQWHLTENHSAQKEAVLSLISQTYQKAKSKGVHILGYISGTTASDVMGSIRLATCTKDHFVCGSCNEDFCKLAEHMQDETLFQECLPMDKEKKWNISPLFKSNSSMARKYYDQDIFFFYIYNQFEFSRVECLSSSIPHLSFLIGALQDQLEKGSGYPIVLQEAHELAVLQNSDIIKLEQYLVQQSKQNSISSICRFKNMAKKVKYI